MIDASPRDNRLADYTEALRLDPNDLLARGIADHNKRDYRRAIADFSAALALRPENPVIINNRAYSYFKNGEYGKAAADYTTLIRLNPGDQDAYVNRAGARFMNKKFVAAAGDLVHYVRSYLGIP